MNNTVVRSLSGIVFLAVMVTAILLNKCTFTSLTTLIIALGMLEFYRITMPKLKPLQAILGILCGVLLNLSIALALAHFYAAMVYLPIGLILFVLAFTGIFISTLYYQQEKPFEQISYLVTGIFYIALPFTVMNFLVAKGIEYNGWPLLGYFILLWANDVGAYCFGITLGRHGKHKLFPRHSPKKSWEGFIGGILMAMLAGFVFSVYAPEIPRVWWVWVVMGIIVSVFATFGDLVESMLKRSVGIKDSGKLMPGHGGMLDRFDGVLLSFIPAYIFYVVFI